MNYSDIERILGSQLGGDLWKAAGQQGNPFQAQNAENGLTEYYGGKQARMLGGLDPSVFNGYNFDWQDTGTGNTGTLTAFKDGQQVFQGKQTDQSTLQSALEAAALGAMAFGGIGALGHGPLAGLFGGAGGAGGAGASSAGAGTAGVTGANGAFLGEGVASGVGAWDAAMANAAAGTAGAIGTLPAQATGAISPMAPETLPMMSKVGAVPALTEAAKFAGGASLAGLLGEAAPYVKAALPIAGAIAGSNPSGGGTQTVQSKTDPRLDPYLYGDQGILSQAQQWFKANQQPNQAMQKGWDMQMGLLSDPNVLQQLGQMRSSAMGLLGGPVAGNGFSSFYGG